jgi:hypothetical protein
LQKICFTIKPYQQCEKWFFDDLKLGLTREGLTDGTPEVLQRAMQIRNLSNAKFHFSDKQKFSFTLKLMGKHRNGHRYFWTEEKMVCWFCPALLRFFSFPPVFIWFEVKPQKIASNL